MQNLWSVKSRLFCYDCLMFSKILNKCILSIMEKLFFFNLGTFYNMYFLTFAKVKEMNQYF